MNKQEFGFLRLPLKRAGFFVLLVLLFNILIACGAGHDADIQIPTESEIPHALSESSETERSESQPESIVREHESEIGLEERESVNIQITVGDVALIATPEDNSSAEAFLALLQEQPITVQMSDYAGMEKVGPLGTDLPRNDMQISVSAGDVILYQGNQITIYYGTNSWNFTKLAVIEDVTKESLLEALGTEDVEVTFSLAQ